MLSENYVPLPQSTYFVIAPIVKSNCYVQAHFDTTSYDEIDDGTYDKSFDESDFDK